MKNSKELINKCDEYRSIFIDKFGVDVVDSSGMRLGHLCEIRNVFYNVLKRKLNMNDQRIADYFQHLGYDKNRTSIWHSLKRTETYYNSSSDHQFMYDTFFTDLKDKDVKALKRSTQLKILKSSLIKDKLDELIDKIPKEKRGEIYDLVNLRVKSWSWKDNLANKTTTYDCSISITENTF